MSIKAYITKHKYLADGCIQITQGSRTFEIPKTAISDKVKIFNGMSIEIKADGTRLIQISFPETKEAMKSFLLSYQMHKDYKNIISPLDEDFHKFSNALTNDVESTHCFWNRFWSYSKRLRKKNENLKNLTKPLLEIFKVVQQNNMCNKILHKLASTHQYKYIISHRDILFDLCKHIDNIDLFLTNPFKVKCPTSWKLDKFRVLENIALAVRLEREKRCVAIISRYIKQQMNEGVRHSCVQRKQVWEHSLKGCISYHINDISHQYIKDTMEKYNGKAFVFHKLTSNTTSTTKTMVYLKEEYDRETRVAESIHDIVQGDEVLYVEDGDISTYVDEYEEIYMEGKHLNDEQKAAVKSVLQNNFTLMTGPPGSGKSDVVKCICYVLTEHCGLKYADILLCAPTGKAASKLKYSKLEEGKEDKEDKDDKDNPNFIKPMTIHSAIYGTMMKSNDGSNDNSDDESDDEDFDMLQNKDFGMFSYKVIIVDEVSMMDTHLSDTFLGCIDKSNTIVMLIGDHNQLPSIGCGDLLRSLVNSKVIQKQQYVELKTVYRYGKDMQDLAKCIKDGIRFPLQNSEHIQWHQMQDVVDIYEQAFDLCNLKKGEGPQENKTCQVIIPTNRKEVGCNTFNEFCHDRLKPDNHRSKHPYPGELVMCIKNHKKPFVANGDVLYFGGLHVQNQKGVHATYNLFRQLQLYNEWNKESSQDKLDVSLPENNIRRCYGITIHKSQGSEWKDVIIMLNKDEHKNMLNRNLLYTAVTRVKKGVLHVFYDDESVLHQCIDKAFERNTCQQDIFLHVFGK